MGTLLRFLIGDRNAILALASARSTIWAGLLFVAAAGLAREYDGVDLARQPWWLLIPPAASIAVSLLLFTVVHARMRLSLWAAMAEPPAGAEFWPAYRAFLGLFWMTAPLALLYAIPYERFLPPGEATAANLWTLALVAAWRVLLITRVLSVLTGRTMTSLFFVVMLLADVVLMVAVAAAPKPIIDIMGGVRLTERESILQGASFLVMVAAALTLPIWLLGSSAVLWRGRMGWNAPPAVPASAPRSRGLLVLAAASVAAFALVLPFTQREQRLRARVERDLKAGRVADAVATMSAHAPGDFPPQWDPPPRPAYHDDAPPLLDVLEVVVEQGAADWVRAAYVDKLERSFLHSMVVHRVYDGGTGAAQWARVERLLDRLPEGPALRSRNERDMERVREALAGVAGEAESSDPDTKPTTAKSAPANE